MPAQERARLALRGPDGEHLLGRDILIGRGRSCAIRVEDPELAPIQVAVRFEGDTCTFRAVAATPPTYWNGVETRSGTLSVGDRLRIGGTEFAAVRPSAAASPPHPGPREPGRSWLHGSAAALPISRRHEASFTDILADEIRKAPWFGLSLLLHALLLWLSIWLTRRPEPEDSIRVQVGVFDGGAPAAPETPQRGPLLEVRREEPSPPLPSPAPKEAIRDEEDPPTADIPLRAASLLPAENQRIGPGRPAPPSGGGDVLRRAGWGLDGDGFRRTVSELRSSGLEIVFVFDSTGSMGGMIGATRQTIEDMLEVLRALVPNARFGLVTYRDRGSEDEYVVRSLPLGRDFWRARNFVHEVEADGGGDVPEAVLDGLRAAFAQRWTPGARRVVILAGDAPPHEYESRDLERAIRAFCRDGRSSVHAIVTSPLRRSTDTRMEFERIARLGGGSIVPFAEYRALMRLVLSLAFGREFERDIDEVFAIVKSDSERTNTRAMEIARSGARVIEEELAKDPVPQDVIRALVRMPRRGVAERLAHMLGDRAAAESSRQAAAYVLQQVLGLDRPPVDAEHGGPIPERDVQVLVKLAAKLPD
ncbi:MAG: hypothetical protein Fur0037_12890 [Planctomycetota bacterium]